MIHRIFSCCDVCAYLNASTARHFAFSNTFASNVAKPLVYFKEMNSMWAHQVVVGR
jgi:hypothetical protein